MDEEQRAFNSMIELYVSYELGLLSSEIQEQLESMDGVIEHSQAHIAKSLIASIVGNKIKEDPEIDLDEAHSLVLEQINANMDYGFCEVFKEENRE